ncbi:hypothetical protein R8Z50_23090 [Longispora sp. K20-0274]|uniref:hypothetical protein n=1 Tax=Longispora sp. K20-0274 TaxID=3088255 RepID=UPI00399BEE14
MRTERWLHHRAGPVELYLGDAAEVAGAMAEGSVDCVFTSPPYDVWHCRPGPTGARTWPPAPSTGRSGRSPLGCHPGGLLLDPFSRAATTGMAAPHLDRRYAGIDIDAGCHQQPKARLAPLLA